MNRNLPAIGVASFLLTLYASVSFCGTRRVSKTIDQACLIALASQSVHRLSAQDFLAQYTDEGVVYHGTSIKVALDYSINKRLFFSDNEFGFSTSGAYYHSSIYAFRRNSTSGAMMPFRFQNPEALNVAIGGRPDLAKLYEEGFDVWVTGKPFTQNLAGAEATSQSVVLNSQVLIFPTQREIVADLEKRIKQNLSQTSTVVLEAYKNLWLKISPSDRVGLTDPSVFLVGRPPAFIMPRPSRLVNPR